MGKRSGASAGSGDTGGWGHLALSKSEPSWHDPFPKIIYHAPLSLVGPFPELKESPYGKASSSLQGGGDILGHEDERLPPTLPHLHVFPAPSALL